MSRRSGSGPYAPAGRPFLPRDFIPLGDSITAGGNGGNSDVKADNRFGDTWPNYASVLSMGRFRMVYNAGKAGDTSAQIAARLQSDVFDKFTAAGITHGTVVILQGTNDTSGNLGGTNTEAAQATFANDLAAIVAVRAAGHVPVLGLLPPSNSDGTTQWLIELKNANKRTLARKYAVPLVDFHTPLVDVSNGHYLAGKYTDATHPNPFGYRDMGQAFVDQLLDSFEPGGPMGPMANTTEDRPALVSSLFNSIRNPLFLKAASTPVPDDNTWSGGSGYTHTLAKNGLLGRGNIATTVGEAGATGNNSLAQTIAATDAISGHVNFVVGDVIGFAVGFSFSGGDASDGVTQCILQLACTASSGAAYLPRLNLSADITKGVWASYGLVVPADTTSLVRSLILNGVGRLAVWEPIARNLTEYGIAA